MVEGVAMIDTQLLDCIGQRLCLLGLSEQSQVTLRQEFAELHISFCLEAELGAAEPYREYEGFSLYLVGGEHCLTLIDDPTSAHSLLIAEA